MMSQIFGYVAFVTLYFDLEHSVSREEIPLILPGTNNLSFFQSLIENNSKVININ